jgi:type IV pilus biogenesis protein CpaD/CtpE
MAIRYERVACVALAGMLLYGCSTTPRFNKNFGTSVRANAAAQVLDPAAAANTNPAAGMDGSAAVIAHGRYQDSFKATEPPIKSLIINNGGGSH